MAFIFNPNPSEGDKQTNPDTGVEYIYSGGAWRALGPKIEDEFDTLDERYVNKVDGYFEIMSPSLGLLGGPEATGSNLFLANNGFIRWGYGEFETAGEYGGYIFMRDDTTFEIGTYKDVDLKINATNPEFVNSPIVPTPSLDEQAANKYYVDNQIGSLPSADDLDKYVKLQGTQYLEKNHWKVIQKNQEDNNRTFIDIYDGEMKLYNVADPTDGNDAWAANKGYVDDVAAEYLPLAGGNLTGNVETTGTFTIDHGTGGPKERKFLIKGETADGIDGDLFYSYKNDDGSLDAVNYKGKMTVDTNIVTKKYVDDKVASSGGGVPVGSIMIWMNSTAPDGWFKLQGGSFSTTTYPLLHAYLQSTEGYTNGRLPNWSGHYPGEYGDHMVNNLGSKVEARTGQPAGGAPRSSNSIPNGTTRTFTATGNTNAYSAGASKVTINENWDNTTRPKTVVVHYIIKHD